MPKLPSNLTYNDLNGLEAKEAILDWVRQLLDSRPELQSHLTLPNADIKIALNIGIDMYVGGSVPVASPPETLTILGGTSLRNEISGSNSNRAPGLEESLSTQNISLGARINAAPIPGGDPPDKVRERHGLPVTRPGYGPRETGSHLFLSDIVEETSKTSPSGGREGVVADGYLFSSEPAGPAAPAPLSQHIPVGSGAIDIDLKGDGIAHAGITVSAGSHRASVKDQGDQKGAAYGSVNGVMDAGPAGLMTGRNNRSRLGFGNNNRG
jgi:hypothetical protein